MYPEPFRYYRPASLAEAIDMLSGLGEGAKPLAGGQSLLPILKLRMDEPSALVDIARLPDLGYLKQEDGVVRMGALATHGVIAESDIAKAVPIVKDCAGGIADAQVRSRGTIGGSVSSADPNCDWPTLLHVLDAEIVCTGPQGERVLPITEFILDAFTTSLQRGELLSEIRFKVPGADSAGAYSVYKRAAPAYPTVAAGVQLSLADGDMCRDIRIVLGGGGPKPLIAVEAEAALRDEALSPDNINTAVDLAVNATDPGPDIRGSSEFKKQLLRAMLLRVFERAMARSKYQTVAGGHYYA